MIVILDLKLAGSGESPDGGQGVTSSPRSRLLWPLAMRDEVKGTEAGS